MGKTYFAQNSLEFALKQMDNNSENNVTCIYFDEIRKECLSKWMAKNPQALVGDGIKATAKDSTTMFKNTLNSELTNIL